MSFWCRHMRPAASLNLNRSNSNSSGALKRLQITKPTLLSNSEASVRQASAAPSRSSVENNGAPALSMMLKVCFKLLKSESFGGQGSRTPTLKAFGNGIPAVIAAVIFSASRLITSPSSIENDFDFIHIQ